MSRAVRIRDHLHAEIERLARENRRTIIDQLELLLEQAIAMTDRAGLSEEEITAASDGSDPGTPGDGSTERLSRPATSSSESSDDHFKPDFKNPKKGK